MAVQAIVGATALKRQAPFGEWGGHMTFVQSVRVEDFYVEL